MKIDSDDRRRGSLWGLAVGDALGAAVEFQPPGSFPLVTDYRDGGPHQLAPGEWTDDTSMALALADSIATVGWDLDDQAQRYVNWWRRGDYSVVGHCFDIGLTVRAALAKFERQGDAAQCGPQSETTSGNGSIMRLAPVPLRYFNWFPDRIDALAQRAVESSFPTHRSPQCLSACRYMTVLLCGLMAGGTRDEVLSPDWPMLQALRNSEPLHAEIDEIARGSFRTKRPSDIAGSGYVVRSLEAALWAFACAEDFAGAVLAAVNLGDDADTTGAVCGQFAGAYWGYTGIPQRWRDGLVKSEMIAAAAERLMAASANE